MIGVRKTRNRNIELWGSSPEPTGHLDLIPTDRARLRLEEEALMLDFVRDGENVAWIRYFGGMAPRADV